MPARSPSFVESFATVVAVELDYGFHAGDRIQFLACCKG
jgi:hypothetical protein